MKQSYINLTDEDCTLNEQMNEKMELFNGWIDEWTKERTNERRNEWTNERTNELTNERMNERTNDWTNERTNERLNERTNERLNEWPICANVILLKDSRVGINNICWRDGFEFHSSGDTNDWAGGWHFEYLSEILLPIIEFEIRLFIDRSIN